ncbi:MAG: hypothetical protein RLZZ597_896 [Cyanobacteriota bacterium]|jgi:hypothetical protein
MGQKRYKEVAIALLVFPNCEITVREFLRWAGDRELVVTR